MRALNIVFSVGLFLIIIGSVYSARMLSIAPAVLALLFIGTIFYVTKIQKEKLAFSNITHLRVTIVTLVVTLTMSGLSILWSVYPELSSDRFFKLLPLFVLSTGFLYFARNIQSNALPKILFLGTVIACLVMQADMYFDFGLYRLTRGISPDAYFMPSELNRAVCFLTLLTLLATQIVKNKLHLAAVLLSYYLVFLYTESQTAQLGFLTGLLSFGLYKLFKDKVIYLYFIILMLVTLPLPWLITAAYEHRPASAGVYINYAANGYSRLEIWDGAARLAQEKPILGYGIETFENIELDIENIYHPDDKILHPHNISLQIWAEFGLTGILVFLLLNAYILKRIVKFQTPSVQTLSLGVWSALMAMGLTGYGMWQGWWLGMIFLLCGIIFSYERQEKEIKHD